MRCTRLAGSTGRKNDARNRHLRTIAQVCRPISSQLRHVATCLVLLRDAQGCKELLRDWLTYRSHLLIGIVTGFLFLQVTTNFTCHPTVILNIFIHHTVILQMKHSRNTCTMQKKNLYITKFAQYNIIDSNCQTQKSIFKSSLAVSLSVTHNSLSDMQKVLKNFTCIYVSRTCSEICMTQRIIGAQ